MALLCVPLLLPLARFQVSSEVRLLLETDPRNFSSYEKVEQILANEEVVVISLECAEVFSPEGLSAVWRVSEAFQGQPGVADVKSLTHSFKPVRRGMSFDIVPLVPAGALPPVEMARLKRFALEHPLMRNVMVAADSRHTFITVTYQEKCDTVAKQRQLRQQVEQVLAPFRREGLRFQTIALPLAEEEIRSSLRRDVQGFVPVAIGLLTLILWLTFRSWRILALVLANQVFALLLIPGVIDLGGFRLNVFSVMLFPLLAGIHLTLLAHLFTAFQRAYATSHDADKAVADALKVVLKSSNFATITTVIGLLSLTIGGVRQVRDFGLLGAMGLSLVHLITFGPGLVLLKWVFQRWPPQTRGTDAPLAVTSLACPLGVKSPTGTAWAAWMTRTVQMRRAWILGIAGAAVVFTVLGMGMIRTDIRAVEFLARQSPTRQAVEELDRIYGGINVVQIEFDSGAPNGINDLAFLKYLEKVHRFAETRPEISGAYSYPQLLAMMNQIWEEERPGSYTLPDNPLVINLFVIALKTYSHPFLAALADPSARAAYLVLRTRDMPADRYLALINEIVDYAQNTKPRGVSISAAQGIHSILEADRRILRSQISSAGITVGIIGLVLALLWRSLWLAFLALLTNIIPVALVVAVAGGLNIPLNSITVMVAAISLGIAVDDSIHFITHWRDERRMGASAAQAVLKTYRVKGRPIVWTSVILISILSVFWFSSFPPVVHFGLLSAIAFAGALAAVLFFLPAMLCLSHRKPLSFVRDV
jgi:predicted RND superfamily exporter protein